MHHRTRYRLSFPPFAIVSACLFALVAMWWGPLDGILSRQAEFLPRLVLGLVAILPLAFVAWYLFSWADVRRGRLTVRSVVSASRVDLGSLVLAEVHGRNRGLVAAALAGGARRRRFDLILRLEDEHGGRTLLPLDAWHDEDLLMAFVLRATVERRVRITGDRMLVRRFSGLLDTYRSWDRQLPDAA